VLSAARATNLFGRVIGVAVPEAYDFNLNLPKMRVSINFQNGSWGPIVEHSGPWTGVVFNDLLRIEIDVVRAVELIRQAGYEGPVFLCYLSQPVTLPQPPNPYYYFTTSSDPAACRVANANAYIHVDAVTGEVTIP
jgi:hypothetical protein